MTRPKYALRYHKCTIRELQQFYIERTGHEDFSLGRHKSYYISLLKDIDAAANIPFLDLAPELRNRVYLELLGLPHHKKKRFPAILRTRKQVYAEAKGILTAIFKMHCSYSRNWLGRFSAFGVMLTGDVGITLPGAETTQQLELLPLFERLLTRLSLVRSFHIEVRFVQGRDGRVYADPAWLVTLFMNHVVLDCQGLRFLTVEVVREENNELLLGTATLREDTVLNVLQPLSKLSELVTLKVIGLGDEEYEEMWKNFRATASSAPISG